MDYISILRTQIISMEEGFIAVLPNIAIAIVVLTATWAVARLAVRMVNKLTGKSTMREDLRQTRSEAIKAIKKGLDAAGIDISFPIRTNYFPEALRIERLPATNSAD